MKKILTSLIFSLISIFSFSQRFTEETLWKEILKDSIKFPEICWRQGIWESGHLKSAYFIQRHNIFGFKTSKGYMYFESDSACVAYYKRWQDRKYKGEKDYYQFLIDINYAANGKDYVAHLKSLKLPKFIYARREESISCE